MSNLSGTKKNPVLPSSIDASIDMPAKLNRWSFIQSDLTRAMDTWQQLDKTEFALNPEDEQLAKIKTIIAQLKAKLEQF